MTAPMPSGSDTAPLFKAHSLGALPVALRLLLCTIVALLLAAPQTVHASRQERTEALMIITPPAHASHRPDPPVHDDAPAARVRQPGRPQVSAYTHHTPATPSATADADRGEDMHAVEPFVMHDAEVSDPVGEAVAAALQYDPWAAHPHAAGAARMRMHAGWGAAAGSGSEAAASSERAYAAGTGTDRYSASYGSGRRTLLHGNRPAHKYSKCSSCSLVSCNTSRTNCSGHCKKNGKLFFCSRKNIAAPFCPPPPPGTLPPTIPDPLRALDTVIIKAPTPYIGCADIANRRTGCPTPLTRGLTADGKEIRVRSSRCVTARYDPHCGSPFFPFGVCMCRLHVSGEGFAGVTRPCDTRELMLRDPPEDVGIAVNVRGRVTYTGFSDYTDGDEVPRYAYDVKVEVGGETVPASMDVFVTEVLLANEEDVIEESYISDDYDYSGIAPGDALADAPADAPADDPADALADDPADAPADAPIGRLSGLRFTRFGGAHKFVAHG